MADRREEAAPRRPRPQLREVLLVEVYGAAQEMLQHLPAPGWKEGDAALKGYRRLTAAVRAMKHFANAKRRKWLARHPEED